MAFIMDGNRRWAEDRHMNRTAGHKFGYATLEHALQWCLDLGVECITVYAFSIENFKRSEDEVALLMRLATHKFNKIVQEKMR